MIVVQRLVLFNFLSIGTGIAVTATMSARIVFASINAGNAQFDFDFI